MSFPSRPSFPTILARVQADFDSALGIVTSGTKRFLAFAKLLSRLSHRMHGVADEVSTDHHPLTATGEPLRMWGRVLGVPHQPAQAAQVTLNITVSAETILEEGQEFSRRDGSLYTLDNGAVLSIGTTPVTVTAVDTGADTNVESGETITLVGDFVNVTSIVASESETGTDAETDDEHRVRVLYRLRNPSHGGNGADYVRWATDVAGVGAAWAVPAPLGEVHVAIVTEDDSSAANLAPTSDLIGAVQNHIDARAPAHATVEVGSPTIVEVTVDLSISPDTPENRTAAQEAIVALYKAKRETNATIYQNVLDAVVANIPTIDTHTINSPTGDTVYSSFQLPFLSGVTFT